MSEMGMCGLRMEKGLFSLRYSALVQFDSVIAIDKIDVVQEIDTIHKINASHKTNLVTIMTSKVGVDHLFAGHSHLQNNLSNVNDRIPWS